MGGTSLQDKDAAAAAVVGLNSATTPGVTPGVTPGEPLVNVVARQGAEIAELRATVARLQTALELLQVHTKHRPVGVPPAGLSPDVRTRVERAVSERQRQAIAKGDPMRGQLQAVVYNELSAKALVGDFFEVNALNGDADAFEAERLALAELPAKIAAREKWEAEERARGKAEALENLQRLKAKKAAS